MASIFKVYLAVITAEAEAYALAGVFAESVIVTLTVFVPAVVNGVTQVASVPVQAPDQEYLYGAVPPVGVAVNVTGLPVVVALGEAVAFTDKPRVTVALAMTVAVFEFASVTVTVAVFVPAVVYDDLKQVLPVPAQSPDHE